MKEQKQHTTKKGPGHFQFFVPFDNSTSVMEKEVGGVQRKFLSGIASSTNKDRENDIVTKEFLAKMRSQALGITVFKEHSWNIDDTLGYITDVSGDENNLVVETLLEPEETNPEVAKILNKLAHGTRLGYSIGGFVTKTSKFKTDDGTICRNLIDGELYEISVTAMPANTDTWLTSLTKSLNSILDSEEDKSTEEEQVSKELDIDPQSLTKILDDVVVQGEIQDKLYDFFWAFFGVTSDVIWNDDLDPSQKKAAIEGIAAEFAQKVEELSSQLAAAVESVATAMEAGEVSSDSATETETSEE